VNETGFSKVIRGQVIKLGDHIDTDLIYPARYVPLADPQEWPKHALEGIDPGFPQRIRQGDIIVCGRNFGCGSARSQAVSCLKLAGIAAVVAASFGRIFFRNAINQGLPIIQCPQAAAEIADGQKILIDLDKGIIDCQDTRLVFEPLPDFLMDILAAGGLITHTRRLLAGQAVRQR
jgi:3-isopropylmalate/(R)-2-methylmalate dehydratase small subunit